MAHGGPLPPPVASRALFGYPEFMAITVRQLKTSRDYLALPDEVRVELFEGEYFMSPSPGFDHQNAVVKLSSILLGHVETRNLGRVLCAPFDCILSEHDVVQPDVLFVATGNLGKIKERLHGAPDLAIEVVSPPHAERDRIVKRDLYRKYGVCEYWIVDPEARSVEVLALDASAWRLAGLYQEADDLTSPLFPDLRIAVRKIFA